MNKETSDQQPATFENREQNVQEATKKEATPSLAEQVRTNPEIQRELDQRITQAITTAKAKWDEEAKLSDDERAAKALATREKALAEKEAAFTLKERTADIKLQLLEKRLPDVLADLIAKGTQNTDEAGISTMPTMTYPTASITSSRRKRSFPRSTPATGSP